MFCSNNDTYHIYLHTRKPEGTIYIAKYCEFVITKSIMITLPEYNDNRLPYTLGIMHNVKVGF